MTIKIPISPKFDYESKCDSVETFHSSTQSLSDQSFSDPALSEPDLISESTCDACPYCSDVCTNNDCPSCIFKKCTSKNTTVRKQLPTVPEPLPSRVNCCDIERLYTRCEVRRHNHIESAWLIAGNYIYDATRYIKSHPAGSTCILLKSGGASDASQDLAFHSRRAMSMWRDCRIGKLTKCPCEKLERNKKSDVCIIS